MFEYAKIKLTLSYLLIIMFVSISFSFAIYKSATTEFRRGFNRIEERFVEGNIRPLGPQPMFVEQTKEVEKAAFISLAYANGIIFVLSALVSYYLAGKTLKPIEMAMDEQRRFIADASHELRTPLTALKTSLQVGIRDNNIDIRSKELLEGNLEDVNKLQRLSDDLLSLSKYQEGLIGKMTTLNTKPIISVVTKKLKPLADDKKIDIKHDLVDQNIQANRDSIEQLITILLDNAIKYSRKKGNIKILSTNTRTKAVIKINDNGIGISKNDLPHVFDRFYQASNSRTKAGTNGHGLGLSLAKRIVDLHDGTIDVKSNLNKGSTLIVKLPR